MAGGYRFGEYVLRPAERELWCRGSRVALASRTFDCLLYLLRARERAVGRDELVQGVWKRANVSDTQLGQTIVRARRAVGDDGDAQRCIRTVPRFGYRWVAPVDEVDDVGDAIEPRSTAASDANAAPRRAWKRFAWIAGAIVAAVVVIAIVALRPSPTGETTTAQPPLAEREVIVAPLRIDADPSYAWLRLGGMDLVAARLRDAGLPVPSSDSTLTVEAVRGFGRDDAADYVDASALRAASGASTVVVGELVQDGARWRGSLHASAGEGSDTVVEAQADDPLHLARLLADTLLAQRGHRAPDAADAPMDARLQQAQAALLGNELELARTLLTQAPASMRARPEWRLRLAEIDVRAGRFDSAEAALQVLLRDAETTLADAVRAQALGMLATMAVHREDYASADAGFGRAVALLGDDADAEQLARVLMGRGVARIALGRHDEGIADLGQARLQWQRAGDRLGMARADANLGIAENERQRPADALVHLRRAADTFRQRGAVQEELATLTRLLEAQLLLARPHDALAASDRALALRERARDPTRAAELLIHHAIVLGELGRIREAHEWLAQADAFSAQTRDPVRAHLALVRAELAAAQGHWPQALEQSQRALDGLPPQRAVQRLIAGLTATRAALALERTGLAQATVDTLATAFDAPDGAPAPLHLTLARAHVADAIGRHDAALELFADAFAAAESAALPQLMTLVAEPYVEALLAADRLDDARRIAGRVSAWSDDDYRAALATARWLAAEGDTAAAQAALEHARRLAGERSLPAMLRESSG